MSKITYYIESFYDCIVWTKCGDSGKTIIRDFQNRNQAIGFAMGNIARGSYGYRFGKKLSSDSNVVWENRMVFAGIPISRKQLEKTRLVAQSPMPVGNTKRIVKTFDGGNYSLRSCDIVLDEFCNMVYPKHRLR